MIEPRRCARWIGLFGIGLVLATTARAHVLYGRPTLSTFVRGSDAVVLVEITAGATPWVAEDQSGRCDGLRARVLETLTAQPLAEEIEFFVHAEGDPRLNPGDRALLFLERTELRPEFSPMKDRFPWYSAQGPGQEWKADGRFGEVRRKIVASWVAAQDPEAVRRVLLSQLSSGDPRLQEDAILELVRARSLPGFFSSPQDVAPFAAFLEGTTLAPSQLRALRALLAPHLALDAGVGTASP